jgi:hypothetical protein
LYFDLCAVSLYGMMAANGLGAHRVKEERQKGKTASVSRGVVVP